MEKDQDFEHIIEFLRGRGVTDDRIRRLADDKVC